MPREPREQGTRGFSCEPTSSQRERGPKSGEAEARHRPRIARKQREGRHRISDQGCAREQVGREEVSPSARVFGTESFSCLFEVAIQNGRGPIVEGMSHGRLPGAPSEAMFFQAERAEERREIPHRMDGGALVDQKPRVVAFDGAKAPTHVRPGFVNAHRKSPRGERDSRGQPIGPRANDNRIQFFHAQALSPPRLLRHGGTLVAPKEATPSDQDAAIGRCRLRRCRRKNPCPHSYNRRPLRWC